MSVEDAHARAQGLAAIAPLNVSREAVALRSLEQAVNRIRRLEVEINAAFEELEHALESCREIKVDAVVRFEKTVEAAWAAHRNQGFAEK